MDRLFRTFISLLAIIILMLMNIGNAWVNQAYAWGEWTKKPTWEKPAWEEAPTWEKEPTWEEAPTWEEPTWTVPPEWNYDPNNPNLGNVQDPNGPGGDPNNSSTTPDGTDPKNPGNGSKNDNNDDKKNEDNKKDKDNNIAGEPFFNFEKVKTEKALEFAVKDVIGGTINLSSKVLDPNNGTLTLQDLLNYKKGVFNAGFKTLTEGDTTGDFLWDSADVVSNSQAVIKNVKTLRTYKTLNDIVNLRTAGTVLQAAQMYDDLQLVSKTFTPANAVVSAIALPFTVIEGVDNYKKIKTAKTSEEKTAAKIDLVKNAGDVITGLAAGVALIPGAQPIAVGMLAVGGALTAASLLYKAYTNRKKIGKDLSEKANKVKKKVTGFFNKVFG